MKGPTKWLSFIWGHSGWSQMKAEISRISENGLLKYVPVPIFVDTRQGVWRPTFSPNNKVNFGERLTLKAPRNGCPSSEVTLVGLKWKLRSQGFQKGAQICSVPIFLDGRQGGWRPTFSPNNKFNFRKRLTLKAPRNGLSFIWGHSGWSRTKAEFSRISERCSNMFCANICGWKARRLEANFFA